jgi:hypothetical protein
MGCPPDPGDVSRWRSNEARAEAEKKLAGLIIQKENSLALFEHLKPLLPPGSEVASLISQINDSIEEPVVKMRDTFFGDPNDPYSYRDVQEADAERDYAFEKLKNKENSLCLIRDGLLKLSPFIPTMPEKIRIALEKERALHLEHREDDRQTWLKWIDDKIRTFNYYIERAGKNNKHKEEEQLRKGLSKLAKEKARVEQLSQEILLRDRDLFGKNEKELDLPYPILRSLLRDK